MEKIFVQFSNEVAALAGRPWTFVACVILVFLWGASGPLFGFGETWQLVINTGTTIITFLMVFVIQNSQNRDGAALHAKLDELIHAVSGADERFVGIEQMTDEDLKALLKRVDERARTIRGLGAPDIETRAENAKAAAKRGKRASDSQTTAKRANRRKTGR